MGRLVGGGGWLFCEGGWTPPTPPPANTALLKISDETSLTVTSGPRSRRICLSELKLPNMVKAVSCDLIDMSFRHWFKQCHSNDKKLINRLDRRTLPPEPRHRCKTLTPYTQFPRNVISSANRNFFGASWLFLLLRLINTLTYLPISFLLIIIYGSVI